METVAEGDVPMHVPKLTDLLWFYGVVVTRLTYLEALYLVDGTKDAMREVRTAELVENPEDFAEGSEKFAFQPAVFSTEEAVDLLRQHRWQLAWEASGR